jgi:hypothetical protein
MGDFSEDTMDLSKCIIALPRLINKYNRKDLAKPWKPRSLGRKIFVCVKLQ